MCKFSGQKGVPKHVQSEIAGLRHFLPRRHFLGFFAAFFCMAFWSSLGVSWASLGLLEALLGSFKSEKMLTVPRENHLFVNAVFWLFAAPNGSLGLILVRLGRIWFQNGFQNGFPKFSKMLSKVFQKMIKKWRPRGSQKG